MSTFKQQYEQRRKKLLENKAICIDNRKLYEKTLNFLEIKLRRKNNLTSLDEACFKTLYGYITKFLKVNEWFKNKPLNELTKSDIKAVLNDLQDSKLLTSRNKPLEDRESYFNKIFRSKLFEFAKKKGIVKKIIEEEFYSFDKQGEVRFFEEDSFRKLVDVCIKINHKLLLWLCWDITENATAFLKSEKRDYRREINPETKEPEYHINLRKENLKRSRTPRTEITNYKETVEYLDLVLKDLKDNDNPFNFGLRQAEKLFSRGVKIIGLKVIPTNDTPTLKDLRPASACNLLKKGWSSDEVNERLGHKVSSSEIDKYINFLAIDKHKTKKKIYDNDLQETIDRLKKVEDREKLANQRAEELKQQVADLIKSQDKQAEIIQRLEANYEEDTPPIRQMVKAKIKN